MLISCFVLGVKSKTYLVLMTSIHTHLSPNYTTCCLKIVLRRVAKMVDCWRTTINNDYLLKPPCVLMFWLGKQHCPFHFAAPVLHIELYRATHKLYTKALVLVYFSGPVAGIHLLISNIFLRKPTTTEGSMV